MRKSKLYAKSPIICEPRENMNRALYIVGWISRALVHFACVFGSALFIADSFGITSPLAEGMPKASVALLAVSCLFVSVCTSLAAYNKKTLAAVPCASAAVFLLFLCIWGNPFLLVRDGVACVWNTAVNRMAEAGYYGFSGYAFTGGFSFDTELCLNVGMAIVAAVFGVIFGLCLIRKGKLLPTAIVCVALLVPVFTYNLTRTNMGMCAAVVFISAALSMSLYDRRYSGREFSFIEKRERKLAKKQAAAQKKAEKRAEKKLLAKRAKTAYESALAISDDRKIAKAAKRAVYTLVKEEKKNRKKALKEERKTAKAEKKKSAKALRAEKKKQKKESAAENKRSRALAKKDKEFAARLAAEKKSAAKAKADVKKARLAEKRRAEHVENEKKRYNIAAGGFAGLCAVVCALVAVWLPGAVVDGDFPEIPVINEPMSVARAYVSAYLSGDDVDLNDLNMYGNLAELAPRTLSFDPLEYEGIQIFSVTGDGQYPIYLKSWTAGNFDESTGTWTGAESDEVVEYRSAFGRKFTPDALKTELYSYLFPTAVNMHTNNAYMIFDGYGFAVEHVNVRRINASSKLIFVPSAMNTDYAVMEYDSLEPIKTKYSYFYDGIYSSRFFDTDVKYSTASFITTLKSPKVGGGIDDEQRYIELALKYIDAYEKCKEAVHYRTDVKGRFEVTTDLDTFTVGENDYGDVDYKFRQALADAGIGEFSDSLVEKYIYMTEEEREEFTKFIESEKEYREYAVETYSTAFGGDEVKELADKILTDAGYHPEYNRLGVLTGFADENGAHVTDHDVVMTAIDYLRDNYTYTLTPAYPENTENSVLHSFLFDTKEGYCTHFATAAAALIRSYGYPVRFCEGYIASDFSKDYSGNTSSKYSTYVLDEDAHAWIEVYFDTVGWTQYETTPEYDEIMYDSDYQFIEQEQEIHTVPQQPDSTPKPEEEEFPEDEPVPGNEEEPETDYVRIALIVGAVIAAVAVVISAVRFVWYILKRRAKVETDKRHELVKEALADERRLKTPESNRALGLEINDIIMLCLKIAGQEPEEGEGCAELAERLEEYYGGLCDAPLYEVFSYVLKAEFGTELSADELHTVADFAIRFVPSVYGGLNPFEKLYWRYIKRLI